MLGLHGARGTSDKEDMPVIYIVSYYVTEKLDNISPSKIGHSMGSLSMVYCPD